MLEDKFDIFQTLLNGDEEKFKALSSKFSDLCEPKLSTKTKELLQISMVIQDTFKNLALVIGKVFDYSINSLNYMAENGEIKPFGEERIVMRRISDDLHQLKSRDSTLYQIPIQS